MKKLSFKLLGLPAAATISVGYLLIGLAWTSWSDKALRSVVSDPDIESVFQMYKAWFYVLLTALLLYAALKRLYWHINRTHAKLLENEERLRLIFDHAEDGILLLKEDYTIIDCNPGICRIFGVDSSADLIGKSIADFSPERQRDGRLSSEAARDVMSKLVMNESQQFYWQHIQPSGALVDVEVSKTRIKLGDATYIQAIVRNVTERFIQEKKREREERRNHLLLELYEKADALSDKELYDLVLDLAVSSTNSEIGFLHLVSDDQETISMTAWSGGLLNDCAAEFDDHYPLEKAGNWVDCVRLKQAVIYNDFPHSPNQKGLPEGHVQMRRFMSVPVIEDGKVRAVLGVGNKEAEYDENDTVQVKLVASELHKIVSQRRLMKALKDSESSLSEAQRIAHIGSWSLDLVNDTLEWSDEVYRIFGLDPDSLTPSFEGFLDVIHPEDREMVQRAYTDSLNNQTPYEIEHRLLLKDGTIKFVRERCETQYANDGIPLRSIGTVQDVTEQKRMHDAVHASEERFRSLLNQAGDAFFLHDLEGRILDVNESACSSLGYNRDELLSLTVLDVEAAVKSNEDLEEVWKSIRSRKPITFEGRHRRKNGTTFPVEVRLGRLELGNDIFLLGLARDISDRKLAEDAAAREQERLKFIFDSLPIGICLNRMHPDGRETRMINDAHLRMAGIRREQDEPASWFKVSHPDDRSRQSTLYRQVDEGKINQFTLDKRYVRTDGQVVWVMFCLQRRKMDDGGFEDLTAVVDITERKLAEELLFKREQEFRALVENSEYIIARFDHDCRRTYVNPAYLEMAQMPRDDLLDCAPEHRSPLSPDDAAVLQGVLHRVLDGGIPESVDLPVTKAGDTQHWYHIHVVPEHDQEGAVESALLTAHDITERKQAAEELLEAKQQLQYILNNTHDVIFQIDLKGNYIFSNVAAEDMTGYPLERLLGMNMMELIAPEHQQMVAGRLEKRIAGDLDETTYSFEIIHKDGHRVWVELETKGVFSEDGTLQAIQGVARDITDRKRMEDALEKRIVSLTRPLDQVDDLVFEDLFDVEEIQRIQDQFAAATNVASGIIRPDGSPITKPTRFTRLCGDVVRKTESGCANCRKSDLFLGRYHPDGPVVQPCLSGGLWDAGVSIVVGGKHVASWLIGQVRDETQTEESMRAYARDIGVDEEEFMEAFEEVPRMSREQFGQISEALHSLVKQLSTTAYMNMQQARFIADEKKRTAELLRLSTAINQSAETVVIADAEGLIQYVNPAFEKTSGYTRDEAVGQNPRILKSEAHSEAFFKDMWGAILAGKPWNGQIHNRHKEGSSYVVDATISPILSQTGEVVNFVGVMRDITKELSLEEQFRQSQKMEAVGRLASGVAHDFNNILQTILGYCGVLLMEADAKSEMGQDVVEIQNAAKRAGQLTRQLLTFSRRQPAMQAEVDLNQVLADQVNMLCRLLGENYSLVFDPLKNLFPVMADHSQIEQVVMNLVVNARDAMPDGGSITIQTSNAVFNDEIPAKARGGGKAYACIAVLDTGSGMKKEVLDHLFEPFFTTKSVGEGTGLGLAIIYNIVDQHGGWIEVESQVGVGSTFRVYIPKGANSDRTERKGDDASPALSRKPPGQKATILLVEDDHQVRKLASLVLDEAGYEVSDTDSVAHAERLLKERPQGFDVLLIDAVLPDRPGIELADGLSGIHASSSVIIFSGHADERVPMDVIEEQGYQFLRKPFSTDSLLKVVQSAMKKRDAGLR